jgi:hypothetical protein
MMIESQVLEGTWEEIAARADEFRGCRVRIEVLTHQQQPDGVRPEPEDSTAGDRPGERIESQTGGKRLPSLVLDHLNGNCEVES